LTPRPSEGNIDALQSFHEPTNSSVAVVTRDASADDHVVLRLGGLDPDATYRIRFQDDQRVLTMTGRQLMNDGVLVSLPDKLTAEVVFVDPI
jgi:hypothetical protein